MEVEKMGIRRPPPRLGFALIVGFALIAPLFSRQFGDNERYGLELPGSKDARMAGTDLLEQRRAGTRHADDEYRQLRYVSGGRGLRHMLPLLAIDQHIDGASKMLGIETFAGRGPVLAHPGVGCRIARKRLVEAAGLIEQAAERKAGRDAALGIGLRPVEQRNQLLDLLRLPQ